MDLNFFKDAELSYLINYSDLLLFQTYFILVGDFLSLHILYRTGSLFEESYNTLQFLQNENDWKKAIERLYNIGLVSFQNRAYELISEIKKRLISDQDFLPNFTGIK